MIRYLLLTVIFIWITTPSFSQKIINGKILEQSGNKPIPFANIGIQNSRIGSISNEDGSFSISIPPSNAKDTLLFSALGYRTKRIPIPLINAGKPIRVLVSPKVTELEAVTVLAKKEKLKTFWLGNKYNRGGNIYADSIAAGSAMALLIENKYPAYHADLAFPVFVEKALLRIAANTFEEFKIRVRFLEVDSITKLPGKDLFNESLIVTSGIKSGWLTFDLSSYNLLIDKSSFFLVFEWILDDSDRIDLLSRYKQYQQQHPEKVTIDTMLVQGEKVPYYNWNNFVAGTSFAVSPIQFSLNNYLCYYRNNSLGEWKRSSSILTARLLVSNQPSFENNVIADKKSKETTLCLDQPAVCEVQKICEDFIEEGAVNGFQLTISVKNRIVMSKGFGFADVATGTPVNTQTRFRIGSISKALTSSALIKLVAEKKLDLDAPVQHYVSIYPQKKYTVSTRQLAGHLSGIRHYTENELFQKKHFNNSLETISIFREDTLLFKPGTKYHYSSFAWNLIGAVIEQISGENYLDYMFKNFWKPLGMLHTYGDIADSTIAGKSKFYYITGEEAENYDLSYKYPAGGLLSTTDDLVRFGNELLHGKYLDTAMAKKIFETQYTSDSVATKYGLGWNILLDRNGHRIWYHAGDLLESSGYLLIYPDDDIIIALLANSREGLTFDIQRIGELFYKK